MTDLQQAQSTTSKLIQNAGEISSDHVVDCTLSASFQITNQQASNKLFIASLLPLECCYRTRHIAKASSFYSVVNIKTKAHLLAGRTYIWLLGRGREA
jgi:hypothetical protein